MTPEEKETLVFGRNRYTKLNSTQMSMYGTIWTIRVTRGEMTPRKPKAPMIRLIWPTTSTVALLETISSRGATRKRAR